MTRFLTPLCPYCTGFSERVDGTAIYPHRPDLAHKVFYRCAPCDAYVGCHPNSTVPLGTLANAELRRWRARLHAVFDPVWQNAGFPGGRRLAYRRLARLMNLAPDDCHIALFDKDQCREAIDRVLNGELTIDDDE